MLNRNRQLPTFFTPGFLPLSSSRGEGREEEALGYLLLAIGYSDQATRY
jgi:hypothetical protein